MSGNREEERENIVSKEVCPPFTARGNPFDVGISPPGSPEGPDHKSCGDRAASLQPRMQNTTNQATPASAAC